MTKQTIQKRIAIVAQGLSGGGAERVASILANHFCERGYRVLFVAVYNDRRDYALRGGIGVFDVRTEGRTPLRRLLDRNNGVYRALKAFSPDVTISFLHNETARSVFAGLPVIFSLRSGRATDFGRGGSGTPCIGAQRQSSFRRRARGRISAGRSGKRGSSFPTRWRRRRFRFGGIVRITIPLSRRAG